MSAGLAQVISSSASSQIKKDPPAFRTGDTVRVHVRIIEGAKERIQIFQGVVIKRRRRNQPSATFTVRKVSYNVGVERTFFLHSPRVEKIEIVNRGVVRRAKLFYLRNMRGKAGKIKSQLYAELGMAAEQAEAAQGGTSTESTKVSAEEEAPQPTTGKAA